MIGKRGIITLLYWGNLGTKSLSPNMRSSPIMRSKPLRMALTTDTCRRYVPAQRPLTPAFGHPQNPSLHIRGNAGGLSNTCCHKISISIYAIKSLIWRILVKPQIKEKITQLISR
jgi:hypothetical protein